MFPFFVVFLIWDRFRLRHGLKSGHCLIQSGIETFLQFQIKRKLLFIACVFHFQRFQRRRKHAHILPKQLPHEGFCSRCGCLSDFIVYHLLQQFLIDSHLSHTVCSKHLPENFHLALGISGNLFFNLSGRYSGTFFRVRLLGFFNDFFAFFKRFFHSISGSLTGLLRPFLNLVYIKHDSVLLVRWERMPCGRFFAACKSLFEPF